MKTKQIMPWNLKPGHRIMIAGVSYSVLHVSKGQRSIYTGASVWRVYYQDDVSPLGYGVELWHGKLNRLPVQKATIRTDMETPAGCDERYTVTKEGTGDLNKPWVARFCGEWIGSKPTPWESRLLCVKAYSERMNLETLAA